jgi:single-strand DNA-binding protein
MARRNTNRWIGTGRLTAAPKSSSLPSGMMKSDFSIASNYFSKQDPDAVNFFECVAFGGTADFVNQYLGRGALVAIDGELRQNRWQDKEGKKHTRVQIIVQNIESLSPKGEPAPEDDGKADAPALPIATGPEYTDDDDVPF